MSWQLWRGDKSEGGEGLAAGACSAAYPRERPPTHVNRDVPPNVSTLPGRVVLLFATLFVLAAPLPSAGAGYVRGVVDGATLELEGGRRVRLAGIEVGPSLDEEAAGALGELAQGHIVELRGVTEDRYGRWLAQQVLREDGVWLQAELLRRGRARVQTRPDARALAVELLAAESEARAAGRGIWRTDIHAVRAVEDVQRLNQDRDSFQIVEGRVLTAAKRHEGVFLNFAKDRHASISVFIGRDALNLFANAGVDPLSLRKSAVRVRGWVTERNGLIIEVTHPEQIERLEEALPQAPPARHKKRRGYSSRDDGWNWLETYP